MAKNQDKKKLDWREERRFRACICTRKAGSNAIPLSRAHLSVISALSDDGRLLMQVHEHSIIDT